MLYKTNVVYQNDGAGAGGDTNPSASPSAGGTVAVDAETLSKLVRGVIAEELKPIKGEIGGLYSRQDKDRNAVRELMDEVKKQEAAGLSSEDAITAAQNTLKNREEAIAEKQMLKDIHSKLFGSSSPESAGNGASGADVKAVAELQRYNLDPNSAESVALLRSLASLTGDAKEAKLKQYILDQVAPKQPPSPAGFTQAPATGGMVQTNVDALQSEINILYRNPSAPGAMKRISEIKELLNKTG